MNTTNYHVKISDLSAECTANSINLKNEVKTALWNNGGSASDTARVALIMNGFMYSFPGVPSTTFYPSIYYHHLDPANIGDVSGSWDTLTATYVIRTIDNRATPYNVFGLSGGSVYGTTVSEPTLLSTPHWQVVVNTDFPNDTGSDPTAGPVGKCTCCYLPHRDGYYASFCASSTRSGCNNACGLPCTGWQLIKSVIIVVVF
jgi:hypothetical protein